MVYDDVLSEICKGDPHAFYFCTAFWNFCHSQDDLLDQDKEVLPDVVVFNSLRLIDAIGGGEFYRKHQAMLWPVIMVTIQAYMMSNEWCKREHVLDRTVSQVLKSQYQDVFFMVAYLVGGFDHMMAMDRKYRMYSFDPCLPNIGENRQEHGHPEQGGELLVPPDAADPGEGGKDDGPDHSGPQ